MLAAPAVHYHLACKWGGGPYWPFFDLFLNVAVRLRKLVLHVRPHDDLRRYFHLLDYLATKWLMRLFFEFGFCQMLMAANHGA